MTDEHFDAYVTQIIDAVRANTPGSAKDVVANLLGEFQEKCYLSGRHALIDRIRRELDGFDDRRTL